MNIFERVIGLAAVVVCLGACSKSAGVGADYAVNPSVSIMFTHASGPQSGFVENPDLLQIRDNGGGDVTLEVSSTSADCSFNLKSSGSTLALLTDEGTPASCSFMGAFASFTNSDILSASGTVMGQLLSFDFTGQYNDSVSSGLQGFTGHTTGQRSD